MRYTVTQQAFRDGFRVYPGDSFEAPEGLKCKYAVPAVEYVKPDEPDSDEFDTFSEMARAEARPPIKRGPGRPPKRMQDEQVI